MAKQMHEIHQPVPYYKEKMENSVDRYFTKLTCDKPIKRGSWGFEVGQPLYLPPHDPDWLLRETQDPTLRVEDIHLRVDWQTLRRLPPSNAIVFNFKALFTPPGSRSSAASQLHKVLPALDEWADEQEQNGWVPYGWKAKILDENPFYPGWERHFESTSCYT